MQHRLLPCPPWSGGNTSLVVRESSEPETGMALPFRCALPLETKEIQEFFLSISDFLKSTELISLKTFQAGDCPEALQAKITSDRHSPEGGGV